MKRLIVLSFLACIIIFSNTYAVWTVLHLAVCGQDKYAVQSILERARRAYTDWHLLREQDEKGRTALHLAVMSGSRKITKTLLKFQASQNIYDLQGYLPIHHAAEQQDIDIIKLLLHYGAAAANDVTFKHETPLVVALRKQNFQAALFFINNGTKIDVVPFDGYSAIYWAHFYHHETIVRLLLMRGANTIIKTNDGEFELWIPQKNRILKPIPSKSHI